MTAGLLRPFRRSLRARLVGSFLLLSIVTVGVVGAVVYVRATDDLTESVFERLDAIAGIKADALDRWVDEQSRNVVFVGVMPGVGDDARDFLDDATPAADRGAAEDRLREVLRKVVSQTADAEEIYILDLDGTVELSTLADHEGISQADEEFFARGSSHTTVQNAYQSTLTNLPTITVATPLFDQDGYGRRVAVIAANLSLQRVDRIVQERTGLGSTGQAYLVGADGKLIQGSTTRDGGVRQSVAIDAVKAGQSGRGLYTDIYGQPVVGVYRWMADHGAGLVAEMTQDEAFGSARQLALTIGLVGLVSALLLALAIALVARRVTGPILSLAATASRVQGGDLQATSGIQAEDEVGALAVAFDEMTAQLRENVETLERRVEERTSELTTALDALAESEQRFRRLVEELPLAVYMDPPGEPMGASLYVSPPIEKMFGYPMDDWKREGFFGTIIHPDDREWVESNVNARASEYRILTKDGRTVWVRDDANIVQDAEGNPEYLLGFFVDTTEQKAAEAELRRQKQYFESLVGVSPVAVVTMDASERVSGWNPAATALFGYSEDEAIGRPIADLILRSDELRAQGEDLTRRALEDGRVQLIAQRMRKDGSLLDAEIVMVPLVIDGEHLGYYAIYHDITELVAARRDADAANQAKSAFLAAMSHEIRTPMNAVIGMSGLLLDTPLNDEQRDYGETIHTSGEALLTIINDILDFSKIEAGRFELDSHPLSLAATVEGALDVMGPVAAKKGLELAYALEPSLPAWMVGDAGRLRQIVLNLLSNAIKFTETGEVVVRVTGEPLAEGRGRWELRLAVSDSGMGIPNDKIGRLFQSFSQADATIARRYGGTGLGLAISRRLAELMDGSLIAESTGVPGEGSTFTLTIRVPEATTPEPLAAPARPDALVGKRVLVVDDNTANLQILVAQLSGFGLTPTAVSSPAEAVDLARTAEAFDVIVTDLRMPTMDGLQLAAAIRSALGPATPPIVLLSSAGHRDRAADGVAAVLVKPVKPAALRDALAAALAGEAVTAVARTPARSPHAPETDASLGIRHPLRVLLAEDNAVNQKLATRLLERMGYTADIANDGREAIASLADGTYDVVLMDVQMPEVDGLEATRQIRERWPGRQIRIIAMTANAMEGDRETCLAAGMDDYLSKPIRPAELAAALLAAPSTGDTPADAPVEAGT
ncbi:MAG TPA: response regulator [Candidatus Limnocylindrales bacterium]|nr:response regulator [Candidatus Limnocylindrales bacterium]